MGLINRLRVTQYRLALDSWANGPSLRIAILSDIHFCWPWMTLGRFDRIVDCTHKLDPDLILLPGDFATAMRGIARDIPSRDWGARVGTLSAPLGVYAVQGNHDWWEDRSAQRERTGPTFVQDALSDAGVSVLSNAAIQIEYRDRVFWLAGLEDQRAFFESRKWNLKREWIGMDDLSHTLSHITNDAPVLLMAHEPDIFPDVPDRVALTVSGHTHGGQIRLFGRAPVVPSHYGERYAYGHIVEDERHLVVSGGLGCSGIPVRFRVTPEIVLIELSGPIA